MNRVRTFYYQVIVCRRLAWQEKLVDDGLESQGLALAHLVEHPIFFFIFNQNECELYSSMGNVGFMESLEIGSWRCS